MKLCCTCCLSGPRCASTLYQSPVNFSRDFWLWMASRCLLPAKLGGSSPWKRTPKSCQVMHLNFGIGYKLLSFISLPLSRLCVWLVVKQVRLNCLILCVFCFLWWFAKSKLVDFSGDAQQNRCKEMAGQFIFTRHHNFFYFCDMNNMSQWCSLACFLKNIPLQFLYKLLKSAHFHFFCRRIS